jgi:hypothetical protein
MPIQSRGHRIQKRPCYPSAEGGTIDSLFDVEDRSVAENEIIPAGRPAGPSCPGRCEALEIVVPKKTAKASDGG